LFANKKRNNGVLGPPRKPFVNLWLPHSLVGEWRRAPWVPGRQFREIRSGKEYGSTTIMTIAQAFASTATGITIADTLPNIGAASSNASLVARVSLFILSGNGAAWASLATQLVGLASKFSANGFRSVVRDSVAFLEDPANAAGLAIVTTIAVSDTAANLLASGAAAAESVASTVVLSQPATLSLASANTLLGLHGFYANGQPVTIADTPAHLAAMTPAALALATAEAILARTVVAAADFAISAAQLGILQGMPHLSLVGFTNTIAVSDTATALAALAPAFSVAASGSLLTHIVPVLSGDATAALAATLAHLPAFGSGGHALTVRDTPANLVSSGAAAGLAIATSNGIDAPAAVSVSMANALAALPGFAADTNPLTIADPPAARLSLSPGVAAWRLMIAMFADREDTLWALAESVYLAMYPPSASGASLDNAVSFAGVGRLKAAKSTVYAAFYGTEGSLVAAGAQACLTDSQTLFDLEAPVTITAAAAVDATVAGIAVANATTYTIAINGTAYSFTSGGGRPSRQSLPASRPRPRRADSRS
jgi:hypothetical protein